MTIIDFKKQIDELKSNLHSQLDASGAVLCQAELSAAHQLLRWFDFLEHSEGTAVCDDLLLAAKGAIVESMGCIAIGFVRPAILSLRIQIDVVLSWLYFKDHPVEWEKVQEKGQGFMLKSNVIKYLTENIDLFGIRFRTLEGTMTRKVDDPYRVLSAHVHNQSSLVMVPFESLGNLVRDKVACTECVQLQADVSEYLNDVILACFADKWASFPSGIFEDTKKRLGSEKTAIVFG